MPLINNIKDKKHIIWDWNGTILNDVQLCVDTMNTLLSDQNLPLISIADYKNLFEFPVRNYYDKLGFDYNKRSFEDLAHDFIDAFMIGVEKCQPFQRIHEILVEVKTAGKKQSILSATDQENLEKLILHFGYADLFDSVFGIDNKFADSKTERGKELIKESTHEKQDIIMIGDTLHDLEVAEKLGIDVVLVTHGHQCQSILNAKHHAVVDLFA